MVVAVVVVVLVVVVVVVVQVVVVVVKVVLDVVALWSLESKKAEANLAGYSHRVTPLAFIHRRVRPLDGWMVVDLFLIYIYILYIYTYVATCQNLLSGLQT